MYLIYNKTTSKIVEIQRKNEYAKTTYYKTMSAAKAALTRLSKKADVTEFPIFDNAIAESAYYYEKLEKQVTKVNMMTGKEFKESINTPHYCSPSSETYWSM